MDISTVYRTLDLLQEFDLVSCVDPPDDQRRYELLGIHGPHLHLVCQACGQITGADLEVARACKTSTTLCPHWTACRFRVCAQPAPPEAPNLITPCTLAAKLLISPSPAACLPGSDFCAIFLL